MFDTTYRYMQTRSAREMEAAALTTTTTTTTTTIDGTLVVLWSCSSCALRESYPPTVGMPVRITHISHRLSILQHLGIWPSIWLAAPTAPAAAAPDCYFQHDGAGSMSHSGEMGASRREDQWVPDARG
jgi:hypothetical protein